MAAKACSADPSLQLLTISRRSERLGIRWRIGVNILLLLFILISLVSLHFGAFPDLAVCPAQPRGLDIPLANSDMSELPWTETCRGLWLTRLSILFQNRSARGAGAIGSGGGYALRPSSGRQALSSCRRSHGLVSTAPWRVRASSAAQSAGISWPAV